MAKPSLDPSKAKVSTGAIEAGDYIVNGSKFQTRKQTDDPQVYLVLELLHLGPDGMALRDAQPQEMTLSLGGKSLASVHPANAQGPHDENPEDLGDATEMEGNSLACEPGVVFNQASSALVFFQSLAKLGFPRDLLDSCYAPIFTGLKFTLATSPTKELNKALDLRLNERPMKDKKTGQDTDLTYKWATKWLNPAYLGAAGTTTGTSTSAPAKQGIAAVPPASTATPDDIAIQVLTNIAAARPGEKNKIKNRQALSGFFSNTFAKGGFPGKELKACQDLLKDDNWLENHVAELGGTFIGGVTTFPEPESNAA